MKSLNADLQLPIFAMAFNEGDGRREGSLESAGSVRGRRWGPGQGSRCPEKQMSHPVWTSTEDAFLWSRGNSDWWQTCAGQMCHLNQWQSLNHPHMGLPHKQDTQTQQRRMQGESRRWGKKTKEVVMVGGRGGYSKRLWGQHSWNMLVWPQKSRHVTKGALHWCSGCMANCAW